MKKATPLTTAVEKPALKPRRSIRSFASRANELTPFQQQLWDQGMQRYGFESPLPKAEPLDLKALFGRTAPRVLEIGFGDGQSFFKMACDFEEKDFIGVEVYRLGILRLLRRLADKP